MKLNKDKVYYFASPYSHKDFNVVESRYLEQQRLVAHLIKAYGALIINPIEMCHNLSQTYELPSGYEFWKTRDRKLISISDAIIVAKMPGWEESIGVTDEIKYARFLQKEVFYIDPETLQLSREFNVNTLGDRDHK